MKPKLAEGSRWEGDTVVDEDGREIGCYHTRLSDPSKSHAFYIKSVHSAFVTDALAVIRAAGLDPVWDAAVRLAEYWESIGYVNQSHLSSDFSQELCDMLSANSAAVAAASEKE